MGAAVSKSARRISAEGAGAGSVGGLDLQGQAASESDGHRHISGTGGQLQFIRRVYVEWRQVVPVHVVYLRTQR